MVIIEICMANPHVHNIMLWRWVQLETRGQMDMFSECSQSMSRVEITRHSDVGVLLGVYRDSGIASRCRQAVFRCP